MNRRFEMFQYRQALVRMRQGDTDRDIARSRLMGRKKLARLRETAAERGWLCPEQALPEDAELAALFERRSLPASCTSSLETHRSRIAAWAEAGISGTAIHAALMRNHGFSGSYSAVRRMLASIEATHPPNPTSTVGGAVLLSINGLMSEVGTTFESLVAPSSVAAGSGQGVRAGWSARAPGVPHSVCAVRADPFAPAATRCLRRESAPTP